MTDPNTEKMLGRLERLSTKPDQMKAIADSKPKPPVVPPELLRNGRVFLERIQTSGLGEAKELVRVAELFDALVSGHLEIREPSSPHDAG